MTLGCWTSVSRKRVLPVIEEPNGPMFHPVQDEGEDSAKNASSTGAAPDQQAIPATDSFFEELGAQKSALLGTGQVHPRTTNNILPARLKSKGMPESDIFANCIPLGHSDWSKIAADGVAPGADGKKVGLIPTINGDANTGFWKELAAAGISADDIPVLAFPVGEEEPSGLDTSNLVGHLAAWNDFPTAESPANADFIEAWTAKTGADRVANDPMEAHVIGFNMWVNAVAKAGTTDVDKLCEAMDGQDFPDLTEIATADPAGEAPRAGFTQRRPSSGIRALIGSALVPFQLSDPDPSLRRASLDAIARDPEPAYPDILRAAAEAPDSALKAAKVGLERLSTIRFDPDAAARVAATDGFAEDRLLAAAIIAGRRFVEVCPEPSPGITGAAQDALDTIAVTLAPKPDRGPRARRAVARLDCPLNLPFMPIPGSRIAARDGHRQQRNGCRGMRRARWRSSGSACRRRRGRPLTWPRRAAGAPWTGFHASRRRFRTQGFAGPKDLPPIHGSHPLIEPWERHRSRRPWRGPPETVATIRVLALDHPSFGCNRFEAMPALEGTRLSSITVRTISNGRQ